jgi:hypothetical protein
MKPIENVQVYKRYMELVLTGQVALLPEVVNVESYREECVGVTPGWIGYAQAIESLGRQLAMMEKLSVEYDQIEVAGDKLFARYHLSATPRGGATPAVAQGCDFIRIADGKIVERWFLSDQLTMLRELGLIPKG